MEEKTASFKDAKGREWSTRFTSAKALRLKDEAKLDVDKIFDPAGGFVDVLINDQYRLIQALEIVTTEQRKQLEIAREDFLEALDGEVLDEAFDALLLGIAVSLPKLRRRALIAMVPRIAMGLDEMVSRVETQIKATGLPDIGGVSGTSPAS